MVNMKTFINHIFNPSLSNNEHILFYTNNIIMEDIISVDTPGAKIQKVENKERESTGKGRLGFIHAELTGAALGTEVLRRQRQSGQKLEGYEGIEELTHSGDFIPHTEVKPNQRKIVFEKTKQKIDGKVKSRRSPFILQADTEAPRSETDTARFTFKTKHPSSNNKVHGIQDDLQIDTHLFDKESGTWKSMTHNFEMMQGNKSLLRVYISKGPRSKPLDPVRASKKEALEKLRDKKVGTWGELKGILGEESLHKLFDPNSHMLHRNSETGTLSAIKISDIHDDAPINVGIEKRPNRTGTAGEGVKQKRAETEAMPIVSVDSSAFMRHHQERGIGMHNFSPQQLLDQLQSTHKSSLEPKKEINEWLNTKLTQFNNTLFSEWNKN